MSDGTDGPEGVGGAISPSGHGAGDDVVAGGSADATSFAEPSYHEKLRTPWWWYAVAIGIAAIFAAEFHVAGLRLTDWIPWGTLLPLSVLFVWRLGRTNLEIVRGELRIVGAKNAHLPLRYVTGSIALDKLTLRRVVGREGDPEAFVSLRPWIGPGVQVWIDDEDDPTPYWLISSRHPDELVRALRSAR